MKDQIENLKKSLEDIFNSMVAAGTDPGQDPFSIQANSNRVEAINKAIKKIIKYQNDFANEPGYTGLEPQGKVKQKNEIKDMEAIVDKILEDLNEISKKYITLLAEWKEKSYVLPTEKSKTLNSLALAQRDVEAAKDSYVRTMQSPSANRY